MFCGGMTRNVLRLRLQRGWNKNNQDNLGEECIRVDDGVLTVSDEDKKIT